MNFLEHDDGQSTVFMAVFASLVMAGFLGFALDTGYLFREQRMAQAAADSAALAAAEEDGYGNTSNVQTVANAAAKMNGFDTTLATHPASVSVTKLTSGNYSNAGSAAAPTTWVQANVSKPIPTFFMGVFNKNRNTMTVSATAIVGEGQSTLTCVCLEATSTQNLDMNNGSKLSAPTCGITANSNSSSAITMYGGATMNAKSLGTVSTNWDTGTNVYGGASLGSTKIVQGITSTCSPTMPAAPVDTNCSADPISLISGGGATYTVGPGSSYGTTLSGNIICYNGLSVGVNSDTVTLNPGIYVINGGNGLTFGSGTQKGGNGVFFYLENGATLTIDNGADVDLVAPSTGTYSGILFYQEASDTNELSIQGGSTAVINGAIYAPGATVYMSNGSGTTVTAEIVAQSLTLAGGGTLSSAPNATLGTLNITGAKLTQ